MYDYLFLVFCVSNRCRAERNFGPGGRKPEDLFIFVQGESFWIEMEEEDVFSGGGVRPVGDSELMDRLRRGDREAFGSIYRRYQANLYTLALRYLKNQADAEDAVQQLFVKLWTIREALYVTTNLRGYLYVMLKHSVLNYMRDHASALQHNYAIVQKGPTCDDDLYTYAERCHRTDLLNWAIGHLPLQQRQVAMMRCEGYSNREIAQRMHLSVNTVNTHYRECVKSLKSYLLHAIKVFLLFYGLMR